MPAHPLPLPEPIAQAIARDPAFRVITIDATGWLDPYSGTVVPAPFGWEEVARSHLIATQPWQHQQRPLPVAELRYLRWLHHLRDRLPAEPYLRVFREGRWLNPFTGKWIAGIQVEGDLVTVRVAEGLAHHLANCPEAEAGHRLADWQLDVLATQGPDHVSTAGRPAVGGRVAQPTGSGSASRRTTVGDSSTTANRVLPVARPTGARRASGESTSGAQPIAPPPAMPGSSADASSGRRPAVARPVGTAVTPVAVPIAPPTAVPTPPESATEVTPALLSLLQRPPRLDGFQTVIHYEPHGTVARDFYDFARIGDHLWVVIGHCAGHGSGLATLAASTLLQLRRLLATADDPLTLVIDLNQAARCDLAHGSSITCQVLRLELTRSRLTCVGAGHPPLALINPRRAQALTMVGARAPALGILDGPLLSSALVAVETQLEPGDLIVAASEGLGRIADPGDPLAGRAALFSPAAARHDQPTAAFVTQLVSATRQAARHPLREDLTVIALRVKDGSWLFGME